MANSNHGFKIVLEARQLFMDLICLVNALILIVSGNPDSTLYSTLCRAYMVLFYGFFMIDGVRTGFAKFTGKQGALLGCMLISAFAAYLANSTGTVIDWLVLVLCYLELPLAVIMLQSFSENYQLLNFRFVRFVACGIGAYFLYSAFVTPVFDAYSNSLTMGYTNSNRTGIYMLLIASLLAILFKRSQKKLWRIIIFAELVGLSAAVPKTDSRMAVLCFILLWLAMFFSEAMVKKLSKKSVLLIIIIPIVFVFLYMRVFSESWLVDTIIYGKSLSSGRNYVYTAALSSIEGKWLLGNYAYAKFGNMHNALLSVLCSCGLLGAVLYVSFYTIAYREWLMFAKNNAKYALPFILLLILYFEGLVEAALFTSGIMYAGLLSMVLIFIYCPANIDMREEDYND